MTIEYNIAMLILGSNLINVPIMSLQSGGELGVIEKEIIDPRKLQVIAYYAKGPRIQSPSVLYSSDIREVGPLGAIVDGADSIMELDDDLVRLKEVLDINFELNGKQVIDEFKKKLGKVSDYTLESDGFYIQKIHVAQSMIKNIASTNLIIHRTQIVELTDDHIVVKSGATPAQVGLTQILNPFRKNQSLNPELSSTRSTFLHDQER